MILTNVPCFVKGLAFDLFIVGCLTCQQLVKKEVFLQVPYGNKADARKDQRLYANFGKMLKAEQTQRYLRGVYCLSAREDKLM